MAIEKEPKQIIKRIKREDGLVLYFPNEKWYEINLDIARAFNKRPETVCPNLNKIINNNPSIEVTTVGQLEMSERLREFPKQKNQTKISNWENAKKLVLAYPSPKKIELPRKSPTSPEEKPKELEEPGQNKEATAYPVPRDTRETRPKEFVMLNNGQKVAGLTTKEAILLKSIVDNTRKGKITGEKELMETHVNSGGSNLSKVSFTRKINSLKEKMEDQTTCTMSKAGDISTKEIGYILTNVE